jgi:phosphatidylglycerol:prolipoprotein diacylglycerol transferase
MCQTLFFIPAEFAGWPVFGPGLLLLVWVVASAGFLGWLAWRQGWNADTWGYVPILLLVGVIIRWVLPAVSEPQGLPIRGYGMLNMLAVVCGATLAVWRGKRLGLDPDTVFSMAFWMLVPGIIGARAFYVTEYWPEYARLYTEPGGGFGPMVAGIVNLAKGGLVVYGAFLGAMAGLIYFVRRNRLRLLPILDLLAPSMTLGLAIGRIGCLMNGCCFGGVCDHPWAIEFPATAPAYYAQVQRGQMYGFTLSSREKAEPNVLAVQPDSPAARAGLKPGDRLVSINEVPLPTTKPAYGAVEQAFYERQPLHIEVEGRAAVTIPAIDPIPDRSLPVHPTQIYSSIDGLLLTLLLLCFAPFHRRDGEVFALLMSTYPISRFYIESLRSDEASILNTGMSIAQNVSVLLLLCAVALWIYIRCQPKGLAPIRPK